ncbi:MAG: hypothetical protein HYU33_03950 [Candidatus Omnitrophica bacterium]|nr:hypothetical protein [Candidatus Omnitrophota bacterium]
MSSRLIQLQYFMVLLLGLVSLRLVHLQLVRGSHYRQLAEQNRLRVVPESAPRGLILDRSGQILATNKTVFRVALLPQEIEDLDGILKYLSPLVHRSVASLHETYKRQRSLPFMPVVIASGISKDMAMRLEEERWRLPGVLLRAETSEELPVLKSYGIRTKELVGRGGIERLLDHALRGRSGGLLVEVDHRARQVRGINRRAPESGSPIVLSIDAPLQRLVTEAFGSQAGACVVLDPNTGAVLAMVSNPSFDPESFLQSDSQTIRQLLDDPQSPLLNRATAGVYTPGSIAKLMTAAAALEQGLIQPSTTIHCPGALRIGDRTFHCWNRDGHGPMTLIEAIMQSCNVYFMQIGRRLGAAPLRSAMEQAGLSHKIGWPLEEQPGRLPQRRLMEGEVALLAIGQGDILVTPLQAAMMASAIGTNGSSAEPWVVSSVGGETLAHRPPKKQLKWSGKTLQAIKAGMLAVVKHPAGTGHRAFSELISIAGKTGTAQTHLPGMTHGWFVGFCPVDQPKAAMAIVAEYGGSGGDLPAYMARLICEHLAGAAP